MRCFLSKKQHKIYAVATVGNTPEGLAKNPNKDYITTSRVGVDFACMDVALENETYRFTVWPDKRWWLEWCPLRWKEADDQCNWRLVCAGKGQKTSGTRMELDFEKEEG
jgi:hypothetical protein